MIERSALQICIASSIFSAYGTNPNCTLIFAGYPCCCCRTSFQVFLYLSLTSDKSFILYRCYRCDVATNRIHRIEEPPDDLSQFFRTIHSPTLILLQLCPPCSGGSFKGAVELQLHEYFWQQKKIKIK